ncbi:MAG: KamA family radical SAM protein [bacterium]|nr:KamA family radical SAM protein [bacterium]
METLDLQKNKLHGSICTINQLKHYIDLSKQEEKDITEVMKIHPMLISKYYLSLINKKDKHDPIRKMIIPSKDEIITEGKYDTSGEAQNTKIPGLQHKYKQTALILSTNRCAAYCRHCFRKRLVGLESSEILSRFSKAVSYIRKHEEINNVLISGGDAFMLPTKIIEQFLKKLSPIKHVDYIRFATRTPVTFPQRIINDKKLPKLLKKYSVKGKKIYVVTHFNHPNEITKYSAKAIAILIKSNIQIYNQTVLLKGVNDNPKVLAELFNKLIKLDVLPYYLFQCRPVKRVKHHFQVSLYQGLKIFEATKKNIGGHIICKRLKYIMSHRTGKIEILGVSKGRMFFKYHHAKLSKNIGKLFSRKLNKQAGWLDDF